MEELSLGIFVVPAIALTLVILGYLHFAKQVVDKQNYKRFILVVAITAFILNFIWEMAQGPLYQGFEYDWKPLSFCALASIADMFSVLILFFAFALVYREVYWIKNMRISRVLMLVTIGSIGAILTELWHTGRGDWYYSDTTPLLPFVAVGVSPVVQFMVLPLLIFLIGNKFLKEKVK